MNASPVVDVVTAVTDRTLAVQVDRLASSVGTGARLVIGAIDTYRAEVACAMRNWPGAEVIPIRGPGWFAADRLPLPGAVVVGADQWLLAGALDVFARLRGEATTYFDEVVLSRNDIATFARKPEWSPRRAVEQDYVGGCVWFPARAIDHLAAQGVDPVVNTYESILELDAARLPIRRLPVAPVARRSVHVDDRRAQPLVARADDGSARAARRRLVAAGVVDAVVEPGPRGISHSIGPRRSHGKLNSSIIIPTVGSTSAVWGRQAPLVFGAIDSLRDAPSSSVTEVVVVVDPRTPAAVRRGLEHRDVVILEGVGEDFNFSARCNQGVAASTGEVIVLLNDDTLIEQPDWLDALLDPLDEPDVGVVGARLLYSDGTLQHAGILLNEQPLHIFRGYAGDDPGPGGLLVVEREVSAVTGACLATPRRLWDELGGLDEHFAVAFNDLDYCLRAGDLGRRVIWTPRCTLYHFESRTRPPEAAPHEIDLLYARWASRMTSDPYGNPNFEPRQAEWIERQPLALEQRIRRVIRSFRKPRFGSLVPMRGRSVPVDRPR